MALNPRGQDTVKGGAVKVSGQWREVVRVNAKTVSVATGYSWTERVLYAHIQDHWAGARWGSEPLGPGARLGTKGSGGMPEIEAAI